MPGMKTIVVSRTLRQEDHPEVVIVPGIEALTDLKASPGKDIWLFGGGKLFRSLADAGMVDTLEVSVMPILLGDGVSLAPNLSKWINLCLVNHRVYSSGAVSLEYAVRRRDPSPVAADKHQSDRSVATAPTPTVALPPVRRQLRRH